MCRPSGRACVHETACPIDLHPCRWQPKRVLTTTLSNQRDGLDNPKRWPSLFNLPTCPIFASAECTELGWICDWISCTMRRPSSYRVRRRRRRRCRRRRRRRRRARRATRRAVAKREGWGGFSGQRTSGSSVRHGCTQSPATVDVPPADHTIMEQRPPFSHGACCCMAAAGLGGRTGQAVRPPHVFGL